MSTTRIDPSIARPSADNRSPDLEGYSAAVVDGLVSHAMKGLFGAPAKGRSGLSRSSHSVWESTTLFMAIMVTICALCAVVSVETSGLWGWLGRIGATLAGLTGIAAWVIGAGVDYVIPPPARETTQKGHLPGRPDSKHALAPHDRRSGLVEYIEGQIWVAQIPLVFYGIQMGTRMTVVKAGPKKELLVYSPVALTDALKAEIDKLGTVTWIVAPNILHHLYVGEWIKAYPKAQAWAAPGLAERRSDLSWAGTLESDATPVPWDRALVDFAVFQGHKLSREVVLYVPAAKTLVVADLIQNLGHGIASGSQLGRFLEAFGMYKRPTPPTDWKLTLEDEALAGRCAAKIGAWDFEQIVLAHGQLIEEDAGDVWNDAFAYVTAQA